MRNAVLAVFLAAFAGPVFAQSEQPQAAYQDYVRSMQNDKNIRIGKSRIFTYDEWVQYCRGEFAGQVVKSRWRRDTTCRKFVNPPAEQFVVAVLPVLQQITPPARAADAQSKINPEEQARWFNEQQRVRLCNANPAASGCLSPWSR